MHGPLLCYRWSKDHGLLISSEKGVKKKRIPTSWVMHAQDQHGSGLESVMFWLQRINFYILKKQREKGIALVLKAKISGWQEAATCIYGMDRMIGSLAFWGCYFSFPSALRSVALFGWQDSFFAIWWCCCLLNWSIKWSMLITRISFHLWNRVGLRSTNTELLFFSKQYRSQEVIWDTGGLLSKKFTLLRNSSSLLHCVSCWFRRFP